MLLKFLAQTLVIWNRRGRLSVDISVLHVVGGALRCPSISFYETPGRKLAHLKRLEPVLGHDLATPYTNYTKLAMPDPCLGLS